MLIFFYTNELVTCLESSEKVQVMATLFFDSKSMIVCLTGAKGRWGLQFLCSPYRFCSTRIILDNINKPVIDNQSGSRRRIWSKSHLRRSDGCLRQKFSRTSHSSNVGTRKGPFEKNEGVGGFVQSPSNHFVTSVGCAGTALLGKKAAMACTVAVEESIANHYNNQIRVLTPGYSVLKNAIQVGCKAAIFLSERI
ncbi:hypothetical protein E2320_012339 [Naja naja]|nr:hypothetical protein E2320_012339 [Naja naja]